jgi:hypothetical protein
MKTICDVYNELCKNIHCSFSPTERRIYVQQPEDIDDLIISESDKANKFNVTRGDDILLNDVEIGKISELLISQTRIEQKEEVNHPKRYGGDTTYECIKVLKAWVSDEEYKGFLRCNAIKYLCRAGKKDEIVQELKKSVWYINKLIESYEKREDLVK